MGDKSGIEWTDATWNPVTGCTKVSAGCKHCYAEALWPRVYGKAGRAFTDVATHPDRLDQPLRWKKPRMVFVNSMSDLFHERVSEGFLDRVFSVMIRSPRHTFQVLTKRPEAMRDYMERGAEGAVEMGGIWPPPNIWLGVSVEDRKTWLERTAVLRETPAALRFVSYEPALGPLGQIDLTDIGWLIWGGESGPKARPGHPDWARSARDQCHATGIPFFLKQRGAWTWEEEDIEDDHLVIPLDWKERPDLYCYLKPDGTLGTGYDGSRGVFLAKRGKSHTGSELDGRQHKEMPA